MKNQTKTVLRFFALCCIYDLVLLVWSGPENVCQSLAKGNRFFLLDFLWVPAIVPVLHALKINRRILGNLFCELTVLLLPRLLFTCYFLAAYFVLADSFLEDGVWYNNIENVGILGYCLLFFLLIAHGRRKAEKKMGKTALLAMIVITCVHLGCFLSNFQMKAYIPDLKMYVKLEKFPFTNARMYFSKNKQFGPDYVEFRNKMNTPYLFLYYIPPCSLYVSRPGGIKQKHFKIIDMKESTKFHIYKNTKGYHTATETVYSDSTIFYKQNYQFVIDGNFTGFSVIDSHANTIFSTKKGR